MKLLLHTSFMLTSLFILQGCTTTDSYRVVHDIAYVSDGGERQQGDLYLPYAKGPHPIALVIHGGGWVGRDRSDMEAAAKVLAKHGFVAFNINYRLAPEHTYPAQLEDTHAALRYLAATAEEWKLDMNRCITVGYSAGAHLALLAAGIPDPNGPKIQAISIGGAPVDFMLYPESPFITKLIGGSPSDLPTVWHDASPINHITPKHPPVFIYHGQFDTLVEPKNAKRLQAALNQNGVRNQLKTRHFLGHLLVGIYLQPSIRDSIPFLKESIK